MRSKCLELCKPCFGVAVFTLFLISCTQTSIQDVLKSGKDIIVVDKVFNTDINLTQLLDYNNLLPGNRVAGITQNVIFVNCMFENINASELNNNQLKSIVFNKQVIFKNCIFNGDLNLSYAQFQDNFQLTDCKISGCLNMKSSWFKGRYADFRHTEIFGKSKITNVTFENQCNFLQCFFHQNVQFQNSVFKGNAFIGGATFENYAGFENTRFYDGVCFDKTIFNRAVFDNAIFLIKATFNNIQFINQASFINSQFIGKTDVIDILTNKQCNTCGATETKTQPIQIK